MSEKPPSILATADKLIAEQAKDGVALGVTFNGGKIGAEVSGRKGIGKGFELGAVARWTVAKGAEGAAVLRWTPKD